MITLKTNHGIIKIELDHENTPMSAKNFLKYVEEGFFDGTIFHRVIDGFMVQGGGFDADMNQPTTHKPILNEAKTGGKNKRGTIAMARTSDPHSASSQFFINVVDNNFLNFSSESAQGWGYCVFAQVVEGMDVVDAIRAVKTTTTDGHENVPVEAVILEEATADEAEAA